MGIATPVSYRVVKERRAVTQTGKYVGFAQGHQSKCSGKTFAILDGTISRLRPREGLRIF